MIQTDMNSLDIINTENITYLNTKVEQLKTMYKDEISLENEIVDLLVFALVKHGKNENQIRQTSQISKILGESLGLGTTYCNVLEQAARIYDIGNIAIIHEIYQKDDELTFEEFDVVKNHTRTGYEILKAQTFSSTQMAAIISLQHHEWWNRGGYPQQLKEKEIDISARIVAIADTVGALFHTRPGRKAWNFNEIIKYIKARNGLQYDPKIVEVFMAKTELIHTILQTDFS